MRNVWDWFMVAWGGTRLAAYWEEEKFRYMARVHSLRRGGSVSAASMLAGFVVIAIMVGVFTGIVTATLITHELLAVRDAQLATFSVENNELRQKNATLCQIATDYRQVVAKQATQVLLAEAVADAHAEYAKGHRFCAQLAVWQIALICEERGGQLWYELTPELIRLAEPTHTMTVERVGDAKFIRVTRRSTE